jgi:hypothetical protein
MKMTRFQARGKTAPKVRSIQGEFLQNEVKCGVAKEDSLTNEAKCGGFASADIAIRSDGAAVRPEAGKCAVDGRGGWF